MRRTSLVSHLMHGIVPVCVLLLIAVPLIASAVTSGGNQNTLGFELENPLKTDSLVEFLELMLDIVVKVAMPFLVLAFVYTGFLFVKGQGSEQGINDAKRAFFWTVVGGLLILGAWTISKAIEGTINELEALGPAFFA
jgi:hypothetical protein